MVGECDEVTVARRDQVRLGGCKRGKGKGKL